MGIFNFISRERELSQFCFFADEKTSLILFLALNILLGLSSDASKSKRPYRDGHQRNSGSASRTRGRDRSSSGGGHPSRRSKDEEKERKRRTSTDRRRQRRERTSSSSRSCSSISSRKRWSLKCVKPREMRSGSNKRTFHRRRRGRSRTRRGESSRDRSKRASRHTSSSRDRGRKRNRASSREPRPRSRSSSSHRRRIIRRAANRALGNLKIIELNSSSLIRRPRHDRFLLRTAKRNEHRNRSRSASQNKALIGRADNKNHNKNLPTALQLITATDSTKETPASVPKQPPEPHEDQQESNSPLRQEDSCPIPPASPAATDRPSSPKSVLSRSASRSSSSSSSSSSSATSTSSTSSSEDSDSSAQSESKSESVDWGTFKAATASGNAKNSYNAPPLEMPYPSCAQADSTRSREIELDYPMPDQINIASPANRPKSCSRPVPVLLPLFRPLSNSSSSDYEENESNHLTQSPQQPMSPLG